MEAIALPPTLTQSVTIFNKQQFYSQMCVTVYGEQNSNQT